MIGLVSAAAYAQSERDASFVDIFLNGRLIEEFALVFQETDTYYIEAYIYDALRLVHDSPDVMELDGKTYRAIPELESLRLSFDPEDLILDIQAPPNLFQASSFSFQRAAPDAAPLDRVSGVFVNYGLYPRSRLLFEDETRFDRVSLSGDFQLVGALESVPGVFEAEAGLFLDDVGALNTNFGGGRWRMDLLAQRKSVVLGETSARGLSLAASERFLGGQISSNFRLEPGFSITPTVALDLLIDQPSEVRVVVNGQSRRIWEAQEGPLRLSDLSFGNGQDVRILVSNEGGETEVFQTTYYTAAQLLRPGLSEFSLNAGVPKIGAVDYDWDRPFISYALRRGITNRLTSGGSVRIDPDRQSLGGGLDASLGLAGTASLNGFYDLGPSGHTQRINGGWFFNHRRNSFGVNASWFSAESDLFGSEQGWSTNLSWSRPVARRSNLSVSAYARRPDEARPIASGVFASIGTRIAGTSLGFNGGFRRVEDNDVFLGLSLSRPLGRYRSGFSRARYDRSRVQSVHAIQQRARRSDGVDLSLSTSIDDQSGFQSLTGSALWRHPKATMSSSVAVSKDSAAINGQVSGSFGLVDGLWFYARRVSGGVAVADLIDAAGTEVFLNNRSVGRTNKAGRVVLPGVIPFQNNRLSIDVNEIPFEYAVEESSLSVFPDRPIAGRVALPVRLNRTGTLTLLLDGGGYPAAGSTVAASEGGATGVVGHNGFVYLSNLSAGQNRMSFRGGGGACSFDVFVEDRVSEFGRVLCE